MRFSIRALSIAVVLAAAAAGRPVPLSDTVETHP
jgi:hypothetical protein